MSLTQFKEEMLTIVHRRSSEYLTHRAPVQSTIEIDNNLLLKGWFYAHSEKSMLSIKLPDNGILKFFLFAGANMEDITIQEVRRNRSRTFQDFDEFVENVFTMYEVTFDIDPANWKDATCTCVSYLQNYMCKHIIGISFRLGILDSPDDILGEAEEPIGPKPRRGRPRKATAALIVD